MAGPSHFIPRNDYSQLNEANALAFADPVRAADFPETKLRFWNDRWASRVGLGALTPDEKIMAFARFDASVVASASGPLAGIQASPLAMRYHGHQFRHYNPQIGDGRGFLFAQCEDPVDHRLLDFGTKGSGQTPHSRSGDGRLTLKGAMREVLATEMLEAFGVTTSKTFSFFETGEQLQRGDEPSPTRSAVLTRLSHGHIRFGTFQRLAVMGEAKLLRELVDYSARVYFPDLVSLDADEKPFAFLEKVIARSADLAASWMIAGFVHGVLNTDNMNITGESFDYGPWRFLPTYDPAFTAAYFDQEGLYSYGRQPEAMYWNLDQLARSLHALVPDGQEQAWQDKFVERLEKFPALFQSALLRRFFTRLGFEMPGVDAADETVGEKIGEEIFVAAFNALGERTVGFEEFFYDWYGGSLRTSAGVVGTAKYASEKFVAFDTLIRARVASGVLRVRNETAAILQTDYYLRGRPESMLVEEVESLWSAIDKNDDWTPLHLKIAALRERGRVHGYGI